MDPDDVGVEKVCRSCCAVVVDVVVAQLIQWTSLDPLGEYTLNDQCHGSIFSPIHF